MSDVINTIRRDVDDDSSIHANGINIQVETKGFFPRRKFIHITGSVDKESDKNKVMQIVNHHAGDNFNVVNDLMIK
jgi:hypothetical protein